jgi:hypothetical protein
MKCYYTDETDTWIKGNIVSTEGGRTVNLSSRNDNGTVVHEITLRQTEIIFSNSYMIITGYIQQTGNDFKLRSVDVSAGWVKPKS